MAWRVGIDIGGTFTDLVAADGESGEWHLRKVPSTPASLAEGAVGGLMGLGGTIPFALVALLAHGTTAGTNALIEGRGARTGLLTTSGFRDLLEIARQQRPSLYDLRTRRPRPLVPRRLRREVPERMGFDGNVIEPMDLTAARHELEFLQEERIESLAICFLHSYANPAHERAVRDIAQQLLPGVYITASSDILPRFREWERLSTTVVNAYLGPLMDRYLDELSRRIAAAGIGPAVHIMQSNGGLCSIAEARAKPASTVLSGPAAGAAGAAALCAQIGVERAIAIDMGGTSTDLCLIEGELPASAPGREVGGYAVELPGVDVRSIGSGGGSLLWADAAGLPQLGPQSAGADPGPACYARGGREPTLTDAMLLLGRLSPDGLLGGEMPLDLEGAQRAMADRFGEPLGLSQERAALGAVELAVANVRRAVESITVARGRDPRDYALISAGGAAPLIACELASALQISEVIVPALPGTFSACGLLVSDVRRDWVRTVLLPASVERLPDMREAFRLLEREARQWLRDNEPQGAGLLLRQVAARYRGQDYELAVEVPSGELEERTLDQTVAAFHEMHEGRYGYSLQGQPVEFVDLMVTAMAKVGPPQSTSGSAPQGRGPLCERGRRELLLEAGRAQPCPVYVRADLRPGTRVSGPAIVQQYDSTVFVAPGYRAQADGLGNLRLSSGVKR